MIALVIPIGVVAQQETELAPPGDFQTPEITQENEADDTQSPVIPPSPGEFSEETIEEAQEQQVRREKTEAVRNRCEVVQERIQNHIDNFDSFTSRHESVFVRLQSNLDTMLARIQSNEELDTVPLATAVSEVNLNIDTFTSAAADYNDAAVAAGSIDCTQDLEAGQLYDALIELRDEASQLRGLRQEIKTSIEDSLKPEIESIKSSIVTSGGDT